MKRYNIEPLTGQLQEDTDGHICLYEDHVKAVEEACSEYANTKLYQEGYRSGVEAEKKVTNRMAHWAVYYWNLTQPEVEEEGNDSL